MPIKHETTSITAVKHGTTSLTAVYHDLTKVFGPAIVSIDKPIIGRRFVQQEMVPVYFTNSDVWISTNSTASSGSTSGTFSQGTTVYGFVKVKSFHNTVPSNWTLISGTTYIPNAIYRTGSITVADSLPHDLTSGTVLSPVSIVVVKYIGFYHLEDGVYRDSTTAEADWGTRGMKAGSFTSSNTLTITQEQSSSGHYNYPYQKTVTWTGGSNIYYYSYISGPEMHYAELTEGYFDIYRVSSVGDQTLIQNEIYSGSASLNTSYAYFIIGIQNSESSS